MKYLVLGLVVACGSPHAGMLFDASPGEDASVVIDAHADAPPDAVPMPPCSTTVDLDGDGLGWECDPVEHISLPNAPNGYLWSHYLVDTTFAVQIGFNCSGYACTDHAAIEVRPDSVMIRRSDSGLTEDVWLKNAPVGGPCIDADHAVWWSSSSLGMTGTVDTTGVFHPLASPLLGSCVLVGNTAALLGMTASTSVVPTITSLTAPAGGALHPFATADFGTIFSPRYQIGFAPAILGVAGQLTQSTATLVQARPGELVPSDVIVDGASTAVVDSVARVESSASSSYWGDAQSAAAWFIVKRSGNEYLVAFTATDVQWARLPQTNFTCDRWPNESVTCSAYDNNANTYSLVVVRGSTVVPVFQNEPANSASVSTVPGSAMQTIQSGARIWVIDAANHASVLASGLANPHSTVRADVALAVGVSAAGDLVLERYRTATGREEITIEHGVDQGFVPTVIVTAEGDAIVGGADDTYVVPATSSIAARLDLPNVGLSGFSRGDSTVIVAGSALYAYDELGPGPRLTMLIAPVVGLKAVALDPKEGPPTDYFAYGASAWLGRIIYTGTSPSLLYAPCTGVTSQARLAGRDRNGIPIGVCDAGGDSMVFELPPSGPQLVAHFQSPADIYADMRLAEHPVVAWGGQSNKTFKEVACLASHPERCWSYYDSNTTVMNIDSLADTFSILSFGTGPTSYELSIIRPLGPGEEPQPLP